MLPQAIAFAVIAGLPPETGIHASVIPVIVAALAGASQRLLSGPNTMVSMMFAAALLPLAAPGSRDYGALAAALTLFAGGVQVVLALAGASRLLVRLPAFVPPALTAGIGLVMIATQIAPATGQMAVPDAAPWRVAYHALLNWPAMNPYAALVAAVTVLAGWLAPRHALVAACVVGAVSAWVLGVLAGPAVVDLERVGNLRLLAGGTALPAIDWDAWYVLKQLAQGAVAIAVVGGLQTVAIARALQRDHGDVFSPRRELLAQGAANVAAALAGGFAGSGSFNRTAAHVKAGARTRAAALLASVFLWGLACVAGPALGHLAVPAVAGIILLIGAGMVKSAAAALARERGGARLAAGGGGGPPGVLGPPFARGGGTVQRPRRRVGAGANLTKD